MDKNKSIDGLKPRKKVAASSTTKKSKTPAKPKTTKPKSTPKSTKSKKIVKAAKNSQPVQAKTINQTSKPNQPKTLSDVKPVSKPPKPSPNEDFLKPVQAFNFDEESGELTATDPSTKAPESPTELEDSQKSKSKFFKKKAKKPISKKKKILKRIGLGFLILILILAIIFIIWGNDILAKITGGQGNLFDLMFMDENYEPLKTDENGRTNILAFGTSGYDMEGTEGEGTHDGAQLTDSIMVISLDQETGDLAMLSLPRDLIASTTCTATGKINEVYWCNNQDNDNEQAGAEALMSEVSNVLGIDFQYYAHLNWGSLVNIVDTLGGINVTLDEDIEDYYYTGAVYEAGTPYTLDGGQALGLARARHGTASGDFSRGASQQKILVGIKDKILSNGLSLTDTLGLASTLGDNLRTNFSVGEMRTAAHLLSDFDFNNARQISLIEPEKLMTTGTVNGISYVLPVGGTYYYDDIKEYVAKMFSSDPKKYEDASILVLNGTDTPGLASTEISALEEEGYVNLEASDAPAGTYTGYTIYALNEDKPGTKALLEEKYHTTALSADSLPAGISPYYDFVLILGDEEIEE